MNAFFKPSNLSRDWNFLRSFGLSMGIAGLVVSLTAFFIDAQKLAINPIGRVTVVSHLASNTEIVRPASAIKSMSADTDHGILVGYVAKLKDFCAKEPAAVSGGRTVLLLRQRTGYIAATTNLNRQKCASYSSSTYYQADNIYAISDRPLAHVSSQQEYIQVDDKR